MTDVSATRSVESLGIFSGAPTFSEPLHVGRPNVGDRDAFFARVNDMFDRRWLSNHGRYVVELEQLIAEMLGVKHCISTCNGTVALEITARAVGLDGEVIVPSFTFVATAHALRWLGITPVFADIDPATLNIDPAHVEELITPRTSGIVGVHVFGRPCQVEALQEIADRRRLRLLFDAAHAFTCTHRGHSIGNFGDAEIVSFHATKFFNTFEGGAILTNDDDLASTARLMGDFGFGATNLTESLGINAKMSEVQAAMGLTGLESLELFVEANRRNHAAYSDGLSDVDGILLHAYDSTERSNYQYVVLEVDPERFGMSRDVLLRLLRAENVLARPYFSPGCHAMEPYCSSGSARLPLPHTERIAERILTLPTGMGVSERDVEGIVGLAAFAHDHAREIHALLTAGVRPG